MSAKSRAESIRFYFAIYQANERDVAETVLADDFTFTSPCDDAIGRATYFARCWPDTRFAATGCAASRSISALPIVAGSAFHRTSRVDQRGPTP
ncbi:MULTISPECIES: hypothetical protein [unclassified Mesorhizobium]|uniref:hypothetical protein n=1 Tax=unclassified Mesorhizobium TaxID=325217 RepID=UPI001D01F442|nr:MULTISPECIES: hypothetical protein [unclassified Mesorhizobium]UCI30341.1 hypothetical protein FJW03_21370 [Mesorhizobium sp. B4-1-4]